MEGKMILSLEAYGKKFTAEISDESKVPEVMDAVYMLLIGATYNPKTIIAGIKEFVDEKESV